MTVPGRPLDVHFAGLEPVRAAVTLTDSESVTTGQCRHSLDTQAGRQAARHGHSDVPPGRAGPHRWHDEPQAGETDSEKVTLRTPYSEGVMP